MRSFRRDSRVAVFVLLFQGIPFAANAAKATRPLEALLQDLNSIGIEVLYSSALIPPDRLTSVESADPLTAARSALAAEGLELFEIAPRRFVVRKIEPTVEAGTPGVPGAVLPEVSVYASRFAIDGRSLDEPMTMNGPEIELVPGAHDDALRALKALPGIASNISARPYIRGSLSEDVLVRFDGITLLDPYHLKNFQSLFSAIDPAAVERLEVFSGGFPVQFGTRSGGVINITPPRMEAGYENRLSASAISAGVSSLGHAKNLPLEWFAAIRRSTLDLLEPVENGLGKPQFSDSLGRLRWSSANGSWAAGWLLLDDQLTLGTPTDEEFARARYRDEYIWLTRDHRFSEDLETRITAVLTSAERERDGSLDVPNVQVGSLTEAQEFDRFELTNTWSYEANPRSSYLMGAELSISHSEYTYARNVLFEPEIAAAFDRVPANSLEMAINPEVMTYALYASNRRRWADFEGELGVRLDAQEFRGSGLHSQVSPRLNLRYDLNPRTRLYASVGRFTQAQHIEEWRTEDGQTRPDPAQSSIHSVLGVTHDFERAGRWSFEAYSKRLTRVSPYFDSMLNPLALLPDLAIDRVRVVPKSSEASGLEINGRTQLTDRVAMWASSSWSRVADDLGYGDILRSWDQSLAASAGLSWTGSRLNLSGVANWHRGWPRTLYDLAGPQAAQQNRIELGPRNSKRWGNYYSLDLRAAWSWTLARGDLSTTLELTNATNRENPCCASFESATPGEGLDVERAGWLPTIVNLGFVFRWRDE